LQLQGAVVACTEQPVFVSVVLAVEVFFELIWTLSFLDASLEGVFLSIPDEGDSRILDMHTQIRRRRHSWTMPKSVFLTMPKYRLTSVEK
jgi:hypothetical protein